MHTAPAKRKIFASIFAVSVVGFMALFFNLYEPWIAVGPELIPDGGFSTPAATNCWSGWNRWTRLVPDSGFNGSPGVVLTGTPTEHGILRFTAYHLNNIPAFRVSLRAATGNVVPGNEKYHIPRAIFFYHDANTNSLFNLHHGVVDLAEDTGWKRYTDFFPVPSGAANARLHIQNLGSGGTLRIDDVSIIPVCPSPAAGGWNFLFGTLWMTAFGLCLFVLRPWKRRYGHSIMITLFLIMVGIVLPGQILDGGIQKTKTIAKKILTRPPPAQTVKAVQAPKPAGDVKSVVPKEEAATSLTRKEAEEAHVAGHLLLFSLLAFLSALSWLTTPQLLRRAATVYAGLTFFAISTEVLQFITPDRSAALGDLAVDMSGMAGAVVLVFLLRRFLNRDKH
jgi:VanZ family protein